MGARVVAIAYALLATLSLGLAFVFRGGHVLEHPAPWMDLDERTRVVASAVLGTAFAALVVASARVFVSRFAWARSLHVELRPFAKGLSAAEIAALAVLSSLGEELFFRALLTPLCGVILSSVLFGLVHQVRGPARFVWIVWAAAVGLGLGGIFALTGSLVGPLLAHALINGVNFFFLREEQARRRPLGGLFRSRLT